MVIGQILTVATAAIAMQAVLPAIWTGFQLVGGSGADSSPISPTGAQNAVVLGLIVLVLTTAINVIGVRLMAVVTSAAVVIEILGVVGSGDGAVLPLRARARHGQHDGRRRTGALLPAVARVVTDGRVRHGRLRLRR